MNTFIIARHGRTEWNLQRRLQGKKNSPLLDESLNQLEMLGERISNLYDVDVIYSSPQERAVNSLKIAFPNKEFICDERLSEINYGTNEGKCIDDIDLSNLIEDPWHFKWTDGESFNDVYNRVNDFIKSINYTNKTILTMAHEGVNKMLVGILARLNKSDMIKLKQPNIAFYIVNNNSIKVMDIYDLNYPNIIFKEV